MGKIALFRDALRRQYLRLVGMSGTPEQGRRTWMQRQLTDLRHLHPARLRRLLLTLLRWSFKPLLWLFLLINSVGLALQLPYIQTRLAQELSRAFSEQIQFPILIGSVYFDWFDVLVLRDVQIRDRAANGMIEVGELSVDFMIKTLIDDGNIHLDEVILANANVRLVDKAGALNINQFIDAINALSGPTTDTTSTGGIFHVGSVRLENVDFSYDAAEEPRMEPGNFDHNHLQFDSIYARVSDLRIVADTIEMAIYKLKSHEPNSNLRINDLTTFFRYTRRQMALMDLYAWVNNSLLRDSLVFQYKRSKEFAQFNDKVRMVAHLRNSIISMQDLHCFAPSLRQYTGQFVITTDFKGKVKDFTLSKMNLQFGGSELRGRATFKGLPNVEETLMDFDLRKSVLFMEDIRQFLPEENWPIIARFGRMSFDGKFFGFANDFAVKGDFRTSLGQLWPDINLKLGAENRYTGRIRTSAFDLGLLTDYPDIVQKIDMDGRIAGSGFLLESADFELEATIKRLGLFGYDYQNLFMDGHLNKQLFAGNLSVRDPHFGFAIGGEINLQDSTFNFEASIDTLVGQKLYAGIKRPFQLRTGIKADFHGLDLDDLHGYLRLTKPYVLYGSEEASLDYLTIDARCQPGMRRLTVEANTFDFEAKGPFDFTNTYQDCLALFEEYVASLRHSPVTDSTYLVQYNQARPLRPAKAVFRFRAADINPLLRLFDEYVYLSEGASFSGEFEVSSLQSHLTVQAQADTILYGNYEFFGNQFRYHGTKEEKPLDFVSSCVLLSRMQTLAGMQTDSLALEAQSAQNQVRFDTHLHHLQTEDRVAVRGMVEMYRERTLINLNQSEFVLLGDDWKMEGTSRIILYNQDSILIDDLKFINQITNGQVEDILIDGVLSKSPQDRLLLTVDNLDMAMFSQYTGKDLRGNANLKATLSEVFGKLKFECDATLDHLKIDRFEMGDFSLKTVWDDPTQHLNMQGGLRRQGDEVISLKGFYAPEAAELSRLDISLLVRGASLQLAEPFIEENVSGLEGTAFGRLNLRGNFGEPILTGSLRVTDGQFKINYLGTVYKVNDVVEFKRDFIGFRKLKLVDSEDHVAFLEGGIYHDRFTDFLVQLKGTMEEFQVLNTTAKDNSLYYGTAFATGKISVFGPFNNLDLNIDARSERGTRIHIPVGGTEISDQQEYITFVSQRKDTAVQARPKEEDFNMRLTMNLEITPDAYVEMIFNKRSGDIIRGKGKGKIKMEIDLKDMFNMYGQVEIQQGSYNFTLLNLVNKEFGISPESKITWTGDPFGAMLDITATYTQPASLAPIIRADSSILNQPEIRRRYPVRVKLGMQGHMLSPAIKFDIEMLEYPPTVVANGVPISLESYVAAFRQRIRNDESEMNRQVFSLIVLMRLSAENTFTGISQSAGGSVSELLTNQLSYWVSQIDPNLEVDIGLNSISRDALNTFQLRLSYTLLDGRLRITRDGGFTNARNNTSTASVLGNWTIEYIITRDGKFRARMYHRQNLNAFNTALSNNSTAGVSLSYTKSFNSLRELFGRRKKTPKVPPPVFVPAKEEEASPPAAGGN